ncbi:MAG: thiol reductant ABC exporter subunit CydC [Salinibacterium sp.]|nr:thiol reductant ABC exporter subunit CydC [Salinibacterium sp.]
MRLDARPASLFVFGLLAALKAAALVGIAQAVATGIVSVIAGTDAWRGAIALGIVSGVLRAAVTWAVPVFAAHASAGRKESLRHDLATRLLAGGGSPVGGAAVAATVGLDELDNYYRTVIPATVTAAVVPLLIGTRILFADWVSALIIVVTVPLVPVFMALVGMHSKERADAASIALQRLSDHLVELARGLPVLVGLRRVEEQSAALRAVSERSRAQTMATLRSAFLSSLVLELISTLSVAVVAVFVGLRLVNGELPLEVGLLALVLAPECFAPFRELGAAFHSSQDGLAALRRVRTLTASPAMESIRKAGPGLRIDNLLVHYGDRTTPAVDGLDLDLARGSVTSLEGPSGSGKSTVLGVLAGVVPAHGGSVTGVDPTRVAWVPQHPSTVADTVLGELELYADAPADARRALEQLGLGAVASADPHQLSPGELRRLAIARGLVRVAAGAELLLVDEPTAHLDPAHARLVEHAIDELRGRVTIVVASHEAGITRLADHRVQLGVPGDAREVEPPTAAPVFITPADRAPAAESSASWREFRTILRSYARLPLAILLATGAALFAVALTALSGWLIVRASEQPPIMYLTVAIVGVRFFGIGRAVLRYAERLVTHDGVLGAVTDLRLRLWAGLAQRGVASRSLATGATALDYLVSSADRVRDLVPRVVIPPAAAGLTGIASLGAVALLYPPALPVLAVTLIVGLGIAPVVALVADRAASTRMSAAQSAVLRRFVAAIAAADDLRANGIAARMLARLDADDQAAGTESRRAAFALGLGHALVVVAGSVGAMLMLASTQAPGTVLAILVLLPIALIDSMLGSVDAVQQWPALRAALAKVGAVASTPTAAAAPSEPIESLELDALCVAWAGATPFGPLTASARRGDWIVVEGPSGSGKSTLLATLLGFLPAASGRLLINGGPGQHSDRIAWCPQEGHLFDSTIRGNLFLARASGDRPGDAELVRALEVAGLGPLVASLPLGLDTRVGPAGSNLSGGERQRLAVARTVLAPADVVLLDEPTAHLDAASAALLMTSLREALRDRIVVLVTHHPSERRVGDERLVLGQDRSEQVRGDGAVDGLGVTRMVDTREHVTL